MNLRITLKGPIILLGLTVLFHAVAGSQGSVPDLEWPLYSINVSQAATGIKDTLFDHAIRELCEAVRLRGDTCKSFDLDSEYLDTISPTRFLDTLGKIILADSSGSIEHWMWAEVLYVLHRDSTRASSLEDWKGLETSLPFFESAYERLKETLKDTIATPYTKALTAFADSLMERAMYRRAYSCCYKALKASPFSGRALECLVKTIVTIPEKLDSTITLIQASGGPRSKKSASIFVGLLCDRVLAVPDAQDADHDLRFWLGSLRSYASDGSEDGLLVSESCSNPVEKLIRELLDRDLPFPEEAALFLKEALDLKLVEPKQCGKLGRAYFALARTDDISDDSTLSLIEQGWKECSSWATMTSREYDKCCPDLCYLLDELLSVNPMTVTTSPDEKSSYCNRLRELWESATIHCCGQEGKDLAGVKLAARCRCDTLEYARLADSLWLFQRPGTDDYLNKALYCDASYGPALFRKAIIAITEKGLEPDFVRGLDQALESATKLENDDGRRNLYIGIRHLLVGNARSGVKSFQRAVENSPSRHDTHYSMGLVKRLIADSLRELGDLCAAADHYRLCKESYESAVSALEQSGGLDITDQSLFNRTRYAEEAIAVDSLMNSCLDSCAEDLVQRSTKLIRQEDYAGAVWAIRSFTDEFRIYATSDLWYNLGLAYFSLDSLPLARNALTDAVALDSRFARGFTLLGLILGSLGYQQDAITDLKMAISLYKEQGNRADTAYYNLARIYFNTEDTAMMCSCLSHVQDLPRANELHRVCQQYRQNR